MCVCVCTRACVFVGMYVKKQRAGVEVAGEGEWSSFRP